MTAAELPHFDGVADDTGEVFDDLKRGDRVDASPCGPPRVDPLRDDAAVNHPFRKRNQLRIGPENDRGGLQRRGNRQETDEERERPCAPHERTHNEYKHSKPNATVTFDGYPRETRAD